MSYDMIEIYEWGDGLVLAPDGDLTQSYYVERQDPVPWAYRAADDCQHLLAGNGYEWHPGAADHSGATEHDWLATFTRDALTLHKTSHNEDCIDYLQVAAQ